MKPSTVGVLLATALTATACSKSSPSADVSTPSGANAMQAIVASTDLYANAPQRVLVGLPFSNGALVSYGTVSFAFSYTGTAASSSAPQPGPKATANYVPTPGTPDGGGSRPSVTQPAEARGLYEATGVTFNEAGFWQVKVVADVEGAGTQTAQATFSVQQQPSLPAPGQPALKTENLTLASKSVPKAAIDSRYTTDGTIPDPELHQWTIAKAIEQHRPALVVFGTPVYCVSRFCGPITDLVDGLSKRYGDRAVFIHIEIYRDFQNNVINRAAADWLYRNGDLTEPWVYLIGADGVILDRWSSLASEQEIAAELQQLPITG